MRQEIRIKKLDAVLDCINEKVMYKTGRIKEGYYLTQDVIDILKSEDLNGKTLEKYHYDQKEVDFVEVLSDIVKNNIKEKKRLEKLREKGIDVDGHHKECTGLWGDDYQGWREDYDGSLQEMKRKSKEFGGHIVDDGIKRGIDLCYIETLNCLPLEQLTEVFGDFFENGNKWKNLTVWDKSEIELLIYEGMQDRLYQLKWGQNCV